MRTEVTSAVVTFQSLACETARGRARTIYNSGYGSLSPDTHLMASVGQMVTKAREDACILPSRVCEGALWLGRESNEKV